MGLDCFWLTDQKVKFKPPLQLCGGMCSGHGQDSFRGKVYNSVVEGISGKSLYNNLTPEDVKEVSEALNKATLKDALRYDTWDIEADEFYDLQRMFAGYAAVGASLEADF